jgi:hypothetical protein
LYFYFMMKWIIGLFAITAFATCKSKKNHKTGDVKYFPVLSYIKGQVADIDTSLYRIMKIETIDSTSDTVFLKRHEFRKYAKDFLTLPDISGPNWRDDYEETKMYDEYMKAVILTYTTTVPDNEVKREDVIVDPQPDENGNSRVRTIIVDKWTRQDDAMIHKNMVWQSDKLFFILTKTDREKQPEKVNKLEVVWNDFPK